MVTYLQFAAGLVLAFGAGILIGLGITTRSIDQGFRRLAQQRRTLEERERIVAPMLELSNLCSTCPGRAHLQPQPVRQTIDPMDDDD